MGHTKNRLHDSFGMWIIFYLLLICIFLSCGFLGFLCIVVTNLKNNNYEMPWCNFLHIFSWCLLTLLGLWAYIHQIYKNLAIIQNIFFLTLPPLLDSNFTYITLPTYINLAPRVSFSLYLFIFNLYISFYDNL